MKTLRNMVNSFASQRVLVVGDVMLDEMIWGKVRRVSPEAPVPVVEFERRSWQAGGAGNTAANILSLGGEVLLGGAVGTDAQGQQLIAVLQNLGLAVDGLVVAPERWTTTKTRLLAHHHQVARIDYERAEPLSSDHEHQLLAWAETQMERVQACLLSDYAKGVITANLAERFIELARRHHKPVLVDPKGTDFRKYRGATLVKPNLHEVERTLHGEIKRDCDLLEAGRRLLELLPGSSVLITRGADGMSLFRHDQPVVHIPSLARHVFDVTGAGDTVAGVLALSLAAGLALEPAAHLANVAAGIVVAKMGAAQLTPQELLQHDELFAC